MGEIGERDRKTGEDTEEGGEKEIGTRGIGRWG